MTVEHDGTLQVLTLDADEAGLCREWFDVVQDLNPVYLEQRDYVLAKRLYEALGMRVPHSILGQAMPSISKDGRRTCTIHQQKPEWRESHTNAQTAAKRLTPESNTSDG